MNCDKCGACCTFFKIKIVGLDDDGKEWLKSHKNVMLGGDYLYFKSPCHNLIRIGKERRCAIYDKRFICCRMMQAGEKDCMEAKEVKKIFE